MRKIFPVYSLAWLLAFLLGPLTGAAIEAPLRASASERPEIWSLPNENELRVARIQNRSAKTQVFWISGPNLADENRFEVLPHAFRDVSLEAWKQASWLRLMAAENQALSVELRSENEALRLRLPSEQGLSFRTRVLPFGELLLFNQAPFSQRVEILIAGQLIKKLEFSAFGKWRWTLPPELSGKLLDIRGEARLGGALLAHKIHRSLEADRRPATFLPRSSKARYFRLGNLAEAESFVVGIEDPVLIDKALEQIAKPWEQSFLPRILMGQIAFGHGQMNRNFQSPLKAPWSWHVKKVLGFAGLASQACDGSPNFLEQSLLSWSQGDGIICFWNYRILEELSEAQVRLGSD